MDEKDQFIQTRWTIEEILRLLELIKQANIIEFLNGKKYKNEALYKMLEIGLAKENIFKTTEQIRFKFKQIKRNYINDKEVKERDDYNKQNWIYYSLLEELIEQNEIKRNLLSTSIKNEIETEVLIKHVDQQQKNTLIKSGEIDKERAKDQAASSTNKRSYEKMINSITSEWTSLNFEVLNFLKKQEKDIIEDLRQNDDKCLAELENILEKDRRETLKGFAEILDKIK